MWELTLEELQTEFKRLFDKDVPVNMKNNYEWINKQIDSIGEDLKEKWKDLTAEEAPKEKKKETPPKTWDILEVISWTLKRDWIFYPKWTKIKYFEWCENLIKDKVLSKVK